MLSLSVNGAVAGSTNKAESSPPRGAALDRDLKKTHEALASFHFLLRYPKSIDEEHAWTILEVLEAERQRLQAWIPLGKGPRRVLEVHLFASEDFEEAYGEAVIGIYDGRLRIPIVSSHERTGIVTSTLTHELVHALVARLTGFSVPLWLQEGLAQYLELDHEFPEPSRLSDTEPLPLLLLDEILIEAADPVLVERAYRESAWAVHFIGERFGISGIRRLLKAYAEGHGDDSALSRACELSRRDFERSLRAWYRQGPSVWRDDAEFDETLTEAGMAWADVYDWHEYYRSQVRPLKSSLRQLLEVMRSPEEEGLGGSCRRLLDKLAALFADETFFDCPDEDVADMLFGAFQRLEELGRSCQARRPDRMDEDLASAERLLEVAAALLATYGLQP